MVWQSGIRKEEVLLDLFMDLVSRGDACKSQAGKKAVGIAGCGI